MSIQEVELHLITDNPWQTRALDEAHAQALSADIAEHGLLQAPVGRIHPQRPEYIQLATGHHRLSAIRRLRQGVYDRQGPNTGDSTWGAVGIDVRELSDLQMAQIAIAENHARKDLSALEKAQSLKRLIDEFGLSQAKAGESFGLGQSAVAHLLRLLRLPEPIQAHVQTGKLPERLARELVTVAKIYPAEAIQIADQIAAEDKPEARESTFEEARDELYRKRGVQLYGIPWKLDWPKAPLKVEGHKSLSEIPACTGCEFLFKEQYGPGTCLRRECFDQKKLEHAWLAVPAGAKKAGLPAGTRGQATSDLIPAGFDEKYLERALKSKHASLVVVPALTKSNWRNEREREQITGSKWLTVATTDAPALEAALPKPKKKSEPKPKPAYDYKAEEAKRLAQEKEVSDLVHRAAPLLSKSIPWTDPVTRLLWDVAAVGAQFGDTGRWKNARTPGERAELLTKALLFEKLEGNVYGDDRYSIKRARDVVQIFAQAFGARLPAGWDGEPEPVVPPAPKITKKPTTRTRPARGASESNAAAAAAATVRAQALAKSNHGRGHSRPAPKPSQQKAKRKTAKVK